jgi:hypothetical protein
MQSLIEAGYTTVLSGGSNNGADVALRDKIAKGEYNGPRIIPSVRIPLTQTPAQARAAVQAMAAQGIRHTAEIALTPEPAPPQAEIEVLKAIVDEAKKAGVQVNVHAVSTPAMVAAVDAGVTRLVHLPEQGLDQLRGGRRGGKDRVDRGGAHRVWRPHHRSRVAAAGGGAVSARQHHAIPRRQAVAGGDSRRQPDPKGRAVGTEAGYTIVNARRIWDADPNHQTMAYSTDQNFTDVVVLEHELKSFSIVFSMADIHRIMGPNSARYVGMADQIGTLESGKLADIILIDGNPTLNIYEMLKTKVVLKEGKIVVDKR